MFIEKRKYQFEIIKNYFKHGQNISKTKLAKKLGISRVTLNKLIKEYLQEKFLTYQRDYANNFIPKIQRQKYFNATITFLNALNDNRDKTKFLPTFELLYPRIVKDKDISLRTFENIIKENNFYLPSCRRSTKSQIRKNIKNQNKIPHFDLITDLEETQILKRFYKKKEGIFGYSVELDACVHFWFNDDKYHLYRAVDSATGFVLCEWIEKEETSSGYLHLLRKLFTKWGKPKLIITDKRKTFWNNEEAKSQVSLMLLSLDIDIICSSEPTAKPNVERSFKDAQQLLPLICFDLKIQSLDQLQKNIDQITLMHNEYFKKQITKESCFIRLSQTEISKTLNFTMQRKVTNGNTLVIDSQHYIPCKGDVRFAMKENTIITIYWNERQKYFIKHNNHCIKLKAVTDDYVIAPISKAWDELNHAKLKNAHVNKMLDEKLHKIEKEKQFLLKLANQLKEKEKRLNSPL